MLRNTRLPAGVVQFSIGYNLMKPSPEQLLQRQLASSGKQMDSADSAQQPPRSGRGPPQNASGPSEDEELLLLREQSALEMQPVSGGLGRGCAAHQHRLCEGEACQSCSVWLGISTVVRQCPQCTGCMKWGHVSALHLMQFR